jgi:P2-related tail formation protein
MKLRDRETGEWVDTPKETEKRKLRQEYQELKAAKGKPTTLADVIERLEKMEKVLGI